MAQEGNSFEQFLFSLKRVPEAEADLDLQISALEHRIDKLVKAVEINGIPILAHILGLTHEQEELQKLAKALDRVAPLVEKHDELHRRKAVLEMARKEPNFFAWSFGDFDNELDDFTNEINPGET